jgi:stearoyl-CoA desaturase (delta-9 desaturase)
MAKSIARPADERVNKITSIPFVLVHFLPLLAFFTGVTLRAVVLGVVLYAVRMFFITAGYHRYFAHRSYRLGRAMQFAMALGGATAAQKGPLWWAGHHRNHHKFSDTERDIHSPLKGFWWSHVGWILCDKFSATDYDGIKDFAKYPELRFLNKHDWIAPWALGFASYLIAGWSGLLIGFFASTVLLWHMTFLVNSLAHVVGRRRYATPDTSRNSAVIALLTSGEGWHNNHHFWPASARQGFYWWEYDVSFYVLKALSWVGLVHDLRTPPSHVKEFSRIDAGHLDIGMFRAYRGKAAAKLARARAKAAKVINRARAHGDESAEAELVALEAKLQAEEHALRELIESTLRSAEEISRAARRNRQQVTA